MVSKEEIENIAHEMGIILYDWQEDFIWDRTTKRWCLLNGRKTGKTCASEFRVVTRLLNDDVKGVGLSGGICITSDGQDQAKEILQGIIAKLSLLGWEFSKEKCRMSEEKKIGYATSQQLYMPNGNRCIVKAVGMRGNALRPYSFHEKIHDESDFQEDSVYVSTSACLAKFNGIEVLQSTANPDGDIDSYFLKAFFGKNPGYKVVCIPTSSVPHISKEFLDAERQRMTKDEYEREYECKIPSKSRHMFNQDLCFSCMNRNRIKFEEIYSDVKFIGVYLRRIEETESIICTNHVQNEISHITIKIFRHNNLSDIEGEITKIVESDEKIKKICIDEGCAGSGAIEELAKRFGERMITGTVMHEKIYDIDGIRSKYYYEDLFTNLLRIMEHRKIVFHDDSFEIVKNLMNIGYKYGELDRIRITGVKPIIKALVRAVFPVWSQKYWIGDVKNSIKII